MGVLLLINILILISCSDTITKGDIMNKKLVVFLNIVYGLIFAFVSNSYILVKTDWNNLYVILTVFLLINIFAGFSIVPRIPIKLKICNHGALLLTTFLFSAAISIIYHIVLGIKTIPENYMVFVWSAVYCIVVNAIIFWNGIICVYLTSYKLGIKLRLLGALCGMIPVVNLIVLKKILFTVYSEIEAEVKRAKLRRNKSCESLCSTKYPILMVHGVFFRDTNFFNYWGRIPEELKFCGAKIFYGNHGSAASIADSANEIANRIKGIVEKTGCEKVNIIAHSKGGLDCRYAIANCDIADKVASLVTVNTPHKGCLFADYLLEKIPESIKNKVALTYNKTLRILGEKDADFLAAVNNLSDAYCVALNHELEMPNGIFTKSIGSVMRNASGGMFPLNFSYHLAAHFDGINDGLVSEKSFKWGDNYTLLTPNGERGISHGDVIDLSRQDVDDFDVRKFYVEIVNELKNNGL